MKPRSLDDVLLRIFAIALLAIVVSAAVLFVGVTIATIGGLFR